MRKHYVKSKLESIGLEALQEMGDDCANWTALSLRLFPQRRVGGNSLTSFISQLKAFGFEGAHFDSSWKHLSRYGGQNRIELGKILAGEHPQYGTHELRLRLVAERIKEEACEVCQLSEWMGEKMPLQLHHKNGISNDHRLENLQIICPNCHWQTDNHRNK